MREGAGRIQDQAPDQPAEHHGSHGETQARSGGAQAEMLGAGGTAHCSQEGGEGRGGRGGREEGGKEALQWNPKMWTPLGPG